MSERQSVRQTERQTERKTAGRQPDIPDSKQGRAAKEPTIVRRGATLLLKQSHLSIFSHDTRQSSAGGPCLT